MPLSQKVKQQGVTVLPRVLYREISGILVEVKSWNLWKCRREPVGLVQEG